MGTTPKELLCRIPKGAMEAVKKNKYMVRKKYRANPKKIKKKPRFVLVETDYDFLYNYNMARVHFQKKYDLSQYELEMIFYLSHLTIFTRQDYNDIPFTTFRPQIKTLLKREIIEQYNMQKTIRFKVYTLTKKYKIMTTNFHQMLLGEMPVPMTHLKLVKRTKVMSASNKAVLLNKLELLRDNF